MNVYEIKLNNGDNIKINLKIEIPLGTPVIVESKIGLEYGIIKAISSNNIKSNSYKFVRVANKKDKDTNQKNKIDAQKAYIKCRELVSKNKVDMKLVDAKFTFDRKQLVFKFISDGRIDFRDLAKKLANIYKTRIELRQIGVRDKAKEIGGCGQCGRELCCKSFLKDFNSVSINMAKNQNIALNPNKINGVCGRLLCCLKYENDCYKDCRKILPKIGNEIKTESGMVTVIEVNPLNQSYKVIDKDKNIMECDISDSIK